ncbi:MAG: response regulator transcription factor [Ornithinimicrobium sp.]
MPSPQVSTPVRSDVPQIALVNDYEVVVQGLRQMLASFHDRIRVADANVHSPRSGPVDITLYDTFAAPQIDAEAVDPFLDDPACGRVVIYSWNTQPELVSTAVEKGVAGYLAKSLTAAELVEALERVHAGELVLPAHDTTSASSEETSRTDKQPAPNRWPGQEHGLSARESEVLALIVQGLTNDEIAARSYLSINTIKTYIRSAYRKIEVDTRARAVIWGMKHGMDADRTSV